MFKPAAQLLRRQPTWVILILAAALLSLVGWIDVITGPEVAFTQFYLVPVCLVAWLLGRRWGYAMTVLAAGVCFLAERMGAAVYTDPHIQNWNFFVRLAFFVVAVFLISTWKSIGARLTAMVDAQTAELRIEISQREKAQTDLRELAAQLSAAEDAERRKLAYEIHDSLSQMLSLLKINLDGAALEAPPRTKLHSRLTECVRTVEELIRQTKTLTFDLHPAMLDDLGLMATLQRYGVEFEQRTDTDVTVTENGARRPLGLPLVNYLFRAIKELMNNAVKHGRAKEIIIAAHWEPNGLRIVVDDDGAGFDAAAALAPDTRRGLGLAGIEERLTSFGGRLNIESAPDQGTRIILEIPLRIDTLKENAYVNSSLAG